MAIHGTALGGGLELAMAGHYRVATADAQLGQPEVKLGHHSRRRGHAAAAAAGRRGKALDMCVTASRFSAAEALDAGIVDAVIDGDLSTRRGRVRGASRPAADRTRKPASARDQLGTPRTNAPLFAAARATGAARSRRRQLAPLKAVEAIEAAATLPFAEGCRRERELFFECVQRRAGQGADPRLLRRAGGRQGPGSRPTSTPRPIARVAIVGAGTMGGGIAMACANAGLAVLLDDTDQAALDAACRRSGGTTTISVSRGRLTADAVDERLGADHVRSSAMTAFADGRPRSSRRSSRTWR